MASVSLLVSLAAVMVGGAGFACGPTRSPCLDVECTSPPAPVCLDPSTLRAYAHPGACVEGACQYESQDYDCPAGCLDGVCGGNPCAGVICDDPPPASCVDGNTVRVHSAYGSCAQGVCEYESQDYDCPSGCLDGVCGGNPCVGVVCDSPPPGSCVDGSHLRQYSAPGTCAEGVCDYASEEVLCPDGCAGDHCVGCTPHWQDTGSCDCTPTACEACTGTVPQADGCGATRTAACTVEAAGCGGTCCAGTCCAGAEVCNQGQCCAPDCTGAQCGSDGCGGTCGTCPSPAVCDQGACVGCGTCAPGEVCQGSDCAPVALLLASPASGSPSLWCPTGYQEAGHWRTGPGAADGAAEASDFHRFKIDRGWIWLCSADPAKVSVVVSGDDCGSAATACAGQARGSWHVGAGCTAGGVIHGVDHLGTQIQAGWLRLCVAPGTAALVEAQTNDCGANGPGCGSLRQSGRWHTDPAVCGTGDTGVGDSGAAIGTGWMALCVDSERFPAVDPSSLSGKVMTGYQGWFGAPGDGSQANAWRHWFRNQTATAANATFDLFPDLSELAADERFASGMTDGNGNPVALYSAYRAKTVARHFRWMAEYDLDGAFLQRFVVEVAPGTANREFRDQVTLNVRAGAEAYGRTFAIMYDISGATPGTFVQTIQADWVHLVDDLGITASPRYQREGGLPLVGLWGLGFPDRPGSVADAQTLLDFFESAPQAKYRASVLGGVPTHWRTGSDSKPGFDVIYHRFAVISPWSVGRYGTDAEVDNFNATVTQPDLADATAHGQEYLPVVWPGFSWANLQQDPGLFNHIPRQGGAFFWKQMTTSLASGVTGLYVAMFDEVDESTAIFKAATTQGGVPAQGQFLSLDADGVSAPSDWYLRLTGAARMTLVGQVPLAPGLPIQ